MEPKGWYSRGYLPHYDGGATTQSLTFCLSGAVPRHLLDLWREELRLLPADEADVARRRRVEACLDQGYGDAWMRDPHVSGIVESAMLHFMGTRYVLHACAVMPTHVHALCTPIPGHTLATILHSWKSYKATRANRHLGRRGEFWMHESYDRYIRDARHFDNVRAYIENNPVKAGLCAAPEDWPWSSASWSERRLPAGQ